MSELQKPNTQQANAGSLGGVTSEFLSNWLRNEVDGMVPARVVSYNDQTNRAVLHPIVMMGGTDGSKIARADVANIPVYRFGGGGFFIRFPLKVGDLGWLAANDNDISLIMQGGGVEDWPNTERLHKFSDAVFFPDTLKQWIISGKNVDAMVIQSMDGSACIAVAQDRVELNVLSASVTILSDSITTVVGGSTITVSPGGVAIASPPGTLTHNGKNVGDTHTHDGSPTAAPGPQSPTGMPL